jgi:hypothetical protein
MAFCPHCGKSVTDQAIKCVACGGELEPKAKAAKFKGTMMMTPGAALPDLMPKPAAQAAAAAPAPEAPAPKPPAAAPPPAAAAAVPSKVAKATMIGTGGAGLPPPVRGGGPLPQAAPPAAGAGPRPSIDPALAETNRAPGFTAPVAPVVHAAPPPEPRAPAPAPAAAPAADAAAREDSQRFLAGDPMAAAPAAPRTQRHDDYDDDAQAAVPKQRTGTMIAIAVVGMVVIVAIGYLAASFIGK